MPLIQYLSRILFDDGALARLGAEIDRLGITRPLLITDPGIAAAGLLDRALAAARPHAPHVFTDTAPNPTEANLTAALTAYRAQGCDGIVALGGGSALDLAKATGLMATHPGHVSDYARNPDSIGRTAPQIAIPTAAGTGAELGRAAVLILEDGSKCVPRSLSMVAGTVICDPTLTHDLPPALTAATGYDALSHGVEAAFSTTPNPPAEAIALRAVALAAANLPRVMAAPDDPQARSDMMMAALMGGMCLQKGLGAAHALANPLAVTGAHHGALIGVLLPPVLAFNTDAAPTATALVRNAAGLAPGTDLAAWARDLAGRIGLAARLSDLGITPGLHATIAPRAAGDHLATTNPRPLTERDARDILSAVA